MGMDGHGKKLVYELVLGFVVILLLVLLRPMFVGQIAGAGTPYTITYQNFSTATNTTVTNTETVTPASAMSVSQADTIYSVVICIVALITLILIILTVLGKL